MKAHLRCRNIKSVCWATKKVFAQTEVMYGKSRVVVELKSSILPEEQKTGILRGYCLDVRLSRIYWAWGPI